MLDEDRSCVVPSPLEKLHPVSPVMVEIILRTVLQIIYNFFKAFSNVCARQRHHNSSTDDFPDTFIARNRGGNSSGMLAELALALVYYHY